MVIPSEGEWPCKRADSICRVNVTSVECLLSITPCLARRVGRVLGPGIYCSPRHKMPFKSRNEGSEYGCRGEQRAPDPTASAAADAAASVAPKLAASTNSPSSYQGQPYIARNIIDIREIERGTSVPPWRSAGQRAHQYTMRIHTGNACVRVHRVHYEQTVRETVAGNTRFEPAFHDMNGIL